MRKYRLRKNTVPRLRAVDRFMYRFITPPPAGAELPPGVRRSIVAGRVWYVRSSLEEIQQQIVYDPDDGNPRRPR